ncbi:MAG: hypothetical protein A2173_08370 [Planctomycetes bacterium RBG_13_44_8b]|nr:MAG: hypothetical protein A2173_08370 [Planctomycetes bacterium RBG_13_44_8b]
MVSSESVVVNYYFLGAIMIQCKDCEFCQIGPGNHRTFKCDPFVNIKEPECIAKWQLMRLDMLLMTYTRMQQWQEKIAPLQDKILKYMEKEMGDIDESEKWKVDDEDEQDKDDKLI